VETPGFATWGLYVIDSTVYIADRSFLTLVNSSVPSNPWVISTIGTASFPVAVATIDTFAYTHDWSTISVVNVANPDTPSFIGWTDLFPQSPEPKGIQVRGSLGYLAGGGVVYRSSTYLIQLHRYFLQISIHPVLQKISMFLIH
jgi:hypothetical protein